MQTFEWVIVLLLAAVLLASLARRLGAPYPAFLAIGGACLALVPGTPDWTLDPQLALALFVAPVLLDAAYDTSLRDLRDNWLPVAGLAVVAVLLTTAAVGLVARWLVPALPWSAAIALGAIVAPPDAAAATAVVRQIGLPHRITKILEGESLLNDATALLIYRLAVGAAAAGSFTLGGVAPTFAIAVLGSLLAGTGIGWLFERWIGRFADIPSAIILQFCGTFGVWILAEQIGLSGILTIVAYAVTIARQAPIRTPARVRVPSYAVWETAVFILNALAFVLVGLQLRPILERLSAPQRLDYALFAAIVLATVIAVRIAWVMTYNIAIRSKLARFGFRPRRPLARPTLHGGLVVSWAGMRGIVTLAAAFALPVELADGHPFPYRDLIVLTAFCVVLGTLVIQGLSLRPLIMRLELRDGDPVAKEVGKARIAAYEAALAVIESDGSGDAGLLRKEYRERLHQAEFGQTEEGPAGLRAEALRRRAIAAARRKAFEWRSTGAIGDDAYHVLEEEFDRAELSAGTAER